MTGTQITTTFVAALGWPDTDNGQADAFAGRDTPQARRYISEVPISDTARVLDLLHRAETPEGALYEPLVEGLAKAAETEAFTAPWLEAADMFLFKLRMTEPEPEPPASFATLEERLPTGEALRYLELLRSALRYSFKRDIGELHDSKDLTGWLTAAIRAALCALVIERIRGGSGELFVSSLATSGDSYRGLLLLQKAYDAGCASLQELLTEDAPIIEALTEMLPSGPGFYDITVDTEDGAARAFEQLLVDAIDERRRGSGQTDQTD